MANLIFVTGPSPSGKSEYINEKRSERSVVYDEPRYANLPEFLDWLEAGYDVYVTAVLPEGSEVRWVSEDDR